MNETTIAVISTLWPISVIITIIVTSIITYHANKKKLNRHWECYWRDVMVTPNEERWKAGTEEAVAKRLALKNLKLKEHSTMRKVLTNVFLAAIGVEILWYLPKVLTLATKWLSLQIK